MATATKECRVCGKEYEYCRTNRTVPGVFRWQDVACCPEHGSIYLARIQKSREGDTITRSAVTDFSDLIEDEEDELFEEDFEDEEGE